MRHQKTELDERYERGGGRRGPELSIEMKLQHRLGNMA